MCGGEDRGRAPCRGMRLTHRHRSAQPSSDGDRRGALPERIAAGVRYPVDKGGDDRDSMHQRVPIAELAGHLRELLLGC